MNKGASKAIPLIQIVRALLESGARREIGCNAFAMVIAVADAQDRLNRQGKDRPVAIYAREFARMTGMVEPETIRAARKRAIESGWLSYQRGKPRKPGLYQAHLPASFDGFTCFDAELDVADDVASDAEPNGIIGGTHCHNSHSLDLNPEPISSPSGAEVITASEKKTRKQRQPPSYTTEDAELAKWMWGLIYTMQPTRKPPNLDQWASDFRLMRETDKRATAEIRQVFEWANEPGNFWRKNILSPDKLRSKWDDLTLQMQEARKGPQKAATTQQPQATPINTKDKYDV